MKQIKSIILLLISIFFYNSYAQDAINKTNANGEKEGLWRGYYESKNPRYEGKFVNGKEIGLFTYFADDQKKTVMATRQFDPKGNAYTIFYDQNKVKVSEGNIYNKQREGIWKYYHKGANTIMSTEPYINGKLEGIRKVFYVHGVLGAEESYQNNLKHGVAKKYNKDAKLVEESYYNQGVLQGQYTVYDESGSIAIQGNFKEDKKKGIWNYYEKGKLIRQINTDTINGYKKPSLLKKK